MADTQTISGKLPNGLTYYIRENREPAKRAEFRLVVDAGSVLEDDDQIGLAHVVEHMAFNGTTHFKQNELVQFFESIGARFGPDLNASTGFDETVYRLTLPTDSSDLIKRGLRVIRDWAVGQVFDSTQVELERGVIIEEWRSGLGAPARLRDQQLVSLFDGSRYSRRLPIGTLASLQSFRHDALVRFYRDWYRPDLMAVIVVGDLDVSQVEAMIRSEFATIQGPKAPRDRSIFPIALHDTARAFTAADPEARISTVVVHYPQPSRGIRTIAEFRRNLVEQLYHSSLNSRLAELTRKPNAAFLGALSGQARFVRASDVVFLSASAKEGKLQPGLEGLLREVERIERYGFVSSELVRQRASLLATLRKAYDERSKTHSRVHAERLIRSVLSGDPVLAAETEYRLAQQLLPDIIVEEVNAVAREWLSKGHPVVVANGPLRPEAPIPTPHALLATLRSTRDSIGPYVDVPTGQSLLENLPQGANLVSERSIAAIGVTEWVLSNGVRVVLKPTDFKQDEVLVDSYSPGGTSLASDAKYVSATFSNVLAEYSGVGHFDPIALSKVLAGRNVAVTPVINSLYEGISGSSSATEIEAMLQLIRLHFTAVRRDSLAFVNLHQMIGAQLKNMPNNPQSVFLDTLGVTLSQHHFRERPGSLILDEIRFTDAYDFFVNRFADASDFTFVLVGAFSLDSVKPLVQRYLGSLPNIGRKERWRDEGIRPPTGVVVREVKKGVAPQSQTSIVFTGSFDDSRENRYLVGALSQALEIRLREKMREDLGGTYSVTVNGNGWSEPTPRYSITIAFGSAPERVRELANAVMHEIHEFQEPGPNDPLVARVKEIQTRARETSLRSNRFWLTQLLRAYRTASDPTEMLEYGRLVEGLTTTAIRDAARRYLRLDNYVQVSLFPEDWGR